MTKNLNEKNNPTPAFNSGYPPTVPASHNMENLHITPLQDEDLGLNLQLSENSEEFYVSSDSEYEWESEDENDGELGLNMKGKKHENSSGNNNVTLSASDGALVALGDEDGDDEEEIGSDEERDILKGIKDEIEQKVREEMKSELAMYKEKMKAIENGQLDGGNLKDDQKDEDLEGMDPKIKEALIKMRKLDRILNKKLKREKEVKRDRILLERRMREEIEELKTVGKEHKESKTNTEKYLSLTLPPSHNEGVVLDTTPVTPVFQTQLDEADVMDEDKKSGKDSGESAENTKTNLNENTESSHSMDKNKKKKHKKKDFIKRNKELAAQAEESIAMTEEEKKRVSSLLTDLDDLPDLPDDDETPFSMEDNPFQISVHQGEGFLPDNIELRSLASIDGQLKNIMPSEDYESLMSGAISHTPQHKLFTRVDVKSVLNCERYGERALLETKEQREMNEKLKIIEEELAKFSLPNEMKLETPSLSGDQLNDLLDQCARTMSRVSSVPDLESLPGMTPRSLQSTSRSSIYENPPVLPHDVLQKLLAEAYCPISSKLTSVAELEEDSEQGEELEPISAETWKVIAEQEINESDFKNFNMAAGSAKNNTEGLSRSQRSSFDEFNPNLMMSHSDQIKTEYKDKRPFLPEISKSPFLISQGLNNEQSLRASSKSEWNSESNQNSIEIIRNRLQDSSMVVESFSDFGDTREGTPTPRPPSCDKRPSSTQSNRSIRSTATNN